MNHSLNSKYKEKVMLRVLLSSVLIALPICVAAQATADGQALLGTWRLASASYNGKEHKIDAATVTLKHVTPDRKGRITRAAGGAYALRGNEYSETPSYGVGSSFAAVKGQTHTFSAKVEAGKWHHSGKLASGLTIEEVWVRVAPR